MKLTSTGKRHPTGLGQPWDDVDLMKLAELRSVWLNAAEIAKRLGMKAGRVRDRIRGDRQRERLGRI